MLFAFLLVLVASDTCVNNPLMRYEFTQVTNLIQCPFPSCSQYLQRTCCGPSNIDAIREKLKPFQAKHQLSAQCQQSIANLICSPCDGDFGTGERTQVCASFSDKLTNSCSQDYFYIQIGGQLRPCTEDSIACSQLNSILKTSNLKAVEMLGFKVAQQQQGFDSKPCLEGQSSSVRKGYASPVKAYKRKHKQSIPQAKWRPNDMATGLFISVGLFMAGSYVVMRCLRRQEDTEHED